MIRISPIPKYPYFLITWAFTLLFLISACSTESGEQTMSEDPPSLESPTLIILGTLQDGGSPHMGCKKDCCKDLFENPDPKRMVVSLGVVDPEHGKKFIFEATPDFTRQSKILSQLLPGIETETPDAIFITHAHIGHYTGLMFLGREAMGASRVPVYTMPELKSFLENNGPWDQLVNLQNIELKPITDEVPVILTSNVTVTAFRVPHRDEYSETVGFRIDGPGKSVLFIPDIDKWGKWKKNIIEELEKVDLAFIDGTFYDGEEIGYRDISEIPHPFISESMHLFSDLPRAEKEKIHFIHFNHTNPVLQGEKTKKLIQAEGFQVAEFMDTFALN